MFSAQTIKRNGISNIIGQSKGMLKVYKLIEKVAQTNASVLIGGETGTGKGLVAKAIHQKSLRCNEPFVAVNCSAFPDHLIEGELFGYEKGAFTGAFNRKLGKFDVAQKGTIFLDEIGDMLLNVQPKILRVLEEKEFERLGGNRTIKADVRVIAASNKDLRRKVEEKTFREDLFYRLNVIHITLPPLRDRKEDIPSLIYYFMNKITVNDKNNCPWISEEAIDCLMNYRFPGNIRELKNIIQRALIISDTGRIGLEDLPGRVVKECRFHRKEPSGGNMKGQALMDALYNAGVFDGNGKPIPKKWVDNLRGWKIENFYEFLINTRGRDFSRKEFASFLAKTASTRGDKYKTAGAFLKILERNCICEHNGKKANLSRYSLSGKFLNSYTPPHRDV